MARRGSSASSTGAGGMRFFERFRTALGKYEEGVHELAPPATAGALDEAARRVGALPPAYRDFLTQWNGARLFLEAYELWPVEQLRREGERVAIGVTDAGPLFLDAEGRVLALDEDTERVALVGSAFDRWLDATMAREALLFERDGEFRETAFDGGDVAPAVARKRAEAALRADPDAAAWHEELGHLLVDAGKVGPAEEALARATALDPSAVDAWSALAALRRASADLDGAEAAFAAAARAEPSPEEAAFAWAQAARCAREAGRVEAASRHAAAALARHASFLDEQRAAAAHLVEERDLDGAIERLALAQAVAPDDAELARLAGLARARRKLAPAD